MDETRPTTATDRRCPCGQELDLCRRQHCPRCGHRIGPRPAAVLARAA